MPAELRWLQKPNDPAHTLRRYGPPPWGKHPPARQLALHEAATLLEVHLVDSGLSGPGWVRLVRALYAQPRVRLLNVSYNALGLRGFEDLSRGMVSHELLPSMEYLYMRETDAEWHNEEEPLESYLAQPDRGGLSESEVVWACAVESLRHSERAKALKAWDMGMDCVELTARIRH